MADQEGGIEWLKRRLYSRNNAPKPRARRKLREASYDVPETWSHDAPAPGVPVVGDHSHEMDGVREPGVVSAADVERHMDDVRRAAEEPEPVIEPEPEPEVRQQQIQRDNSNRMIRTIFLGSLAFFLISLGIAAYMFLAGSNVVSADNIDINVTGPLAIPGGEELVLQLGVINRNPVPIKLVDLVVEFPEGTRSAADTSIDLPRYRESLGTISSGEQVQSTVRAVLFGTEGSEKNIRITVEYRIDGSNALFFHEREYSVKISSSPVTISVESLSETTSGQSVDFAVKLHSNANEVMENILVRAYYPFGFDVRTTDPAPTFEKDSWQLGDLAPGDEREIRLSGVLVGDNTDERVFKFEVGTQSAQNPEEIAASFETVEVPVSIRRPFLALSLELEGDASAEDVVVSPGARVQGTLSWANNLDVPIHDVELAVTLDGAAIDRSTVSGQGGFFRSQDNTIVWNRETNNVFAMVEPGQNGRVNFSFETNELTQGASQRNALIAVNANVTGRRLSETQVPELLESVVQRTVRIQTGLHLASRAVYTVGPFENYGPLPPRAESQTTYTVIWNVANTSNEATDVRVVASLPSYVEWLGVTSPEGTSIAFEPTQRQLVWTVGDVAAGTGYELPSKEVAFQIAFEPSLSQVGQNPVLVNAQTLTGLDKFTGSMLQTGRPALTTNISTDPNVGQDRGRVMP
jgi:hypothetical protein